MMDHKYVKYLNRPKRARYNADSEVILQQILQASIWNSCLSFQENETRPLQRKYFACADKTNLRAEMKFDFKTVPSSCSCKYRHQNCQRHKSACNHVSEKWNNNCKSNKVHSALLKCPTINGNYFSTKKQTCSFNRNGYKLKTKHKYRHSPYVKSKDMFYRSNHVVSFKSNFQPIHLSNILTDTSSNHVIKADSLCSCETVAMPLASCTYEKDSTSFLIRKALALYLALMFSVKNSKKEFDGKIALTSSQKKLVKILCKLINTKPAACKSKLHHRKKSLPSEAEFYSYCYYDKSGIETTLETVLKNGSAFDHCASFQTVNSLLMSELEKEKDSSKEYDDYGRGDSVLIFNSLVPSYCHHSVCNSHCSFRKKCEASANEKTNFFNKRISSRLQKKRNSGVPGPYSADYVVEVPVIKTKKNKLSHPYSHPLFWNFYSNQEESESRRWNTLAVTYFQMTKSRDHNDLSKKSDDLSFLNPSHNEPYLKTTDSSRSCSLCGRSFDGWQPNERTLHIARHEQSSWPSFHVPLFSLNKRPPKPRVVEEEKPPKQSSQAPPERTLQAIVKQDTSKKIDTFKKITVEKPIAREIVSTNGFRKRPTARKSNGCW